MSVGDLYENRVLDAVLGDSRAPNMPASVWVKLYTTMPTDAAGSGVEASYTGYARVELANNSVNWPNAVAGAKSNGTDITFPASTDPVAQTILGWGITDGALSADDIFNGALSQSKTINDTDQPQFAAATLTLTCN